MMGVAPHTFLLHRLVHRISSSAIILALFPQHSLLQALLDNAATEIHGGQLMLSITKQAELLALGLGRFHNSKTILKHLDEPQRRPCENPSRGFGSEAEAECRSNGMEA